MKSPIIYRKIYQAMNDDELREALKAARRDVLLRLPGAVERWRELRREALDRRLDQVLWWKGKDEMTDKKKERRFKVRLYLREIGTKREYELDDNYAPLDVVKGLIPELC